MNVTSKQAKKRELFRKLIDLTTFDVHRYDGCADFDCIAWYNCLTFRNSVAIYIGPDECRRDIEAGRDDQGTPMMLQLIEQPIPSRGLEKPLLPYGKSIYDVDIRRIWRARDVFLGLPEAMAACQLEDARDPDVDCEPPELVYQSLHSHMLAKDVPIYDHPLVAVNLDATDEVIRSQFAAWLAAKRSEMRSHGLVAAPRAFTEADFREWHNNRVLAFIDLELLARHWSLKLTDEMIGDRLFPGQDISVAEKIRKTVRPLARRLRLGSTMNALQIQANFEFEQRKKSLC